MNKASAKLEEEFLQFATDAARRSCLPGLDEVLFVQNSAALSPAAANNLSTLATGNTVAVISGQQVGLFLGPLFSIYKAIAAISYAKYLRARNISAVPVFWLQTEDHDYDEIRYAVFQTRECDLCNLELPPREMTERDSNRKSVEEVRIPASISQLKQRAAAELGHLPHFPWLLELLDRHYYQGARLSDAFSGLLSELTAEHGLISFNPRAKTARVLYKDLFKWAFYKRSEIYACLKKSEARLIDCGETPQVNLREASPLFFFHPDGPEGPRYRLLEEKGFWRVLGRAESLVNELSEAELVLALESTPEKFSTSALLRPLLQDMLFPTAAYIGGPAERRYFKQLLPLYDLRPYPAPCILPRPSFLLLDDKVDKYMSQLKLPLEEMIGSREEAFKCLVAKHSGSLPTPDEVEKISHQGLTSAFSPYRELFANLNPGLLKPLEKSEKKALSGLSSLKQHYERTLIEQNDLAQERLRKVRNLLRPNEQPQERHLSALYYLARYGPEFILKLLAEARLFIEEEQQLRDF